MEQQTALWKRLWDYDPNGLLVLDELMRIVLVNPALCRMLKRDRSELVGQLAADVLGDVREFERAHREGVEVLGVERAYPRYDLYVRKVIFPVPSEKVVAGIFVDLTSEWKQSLEMKELRSKVIQEVRQVVDKQMNVAQEIAGLLGETTAETKVGMLRLIELLRREHD